MAKPYVEIEQNKALQRLANKWNATLHAYPRQLIVDGAIGPLSRAAFASLPDNWQTLPAPQEPYFVDSFAPVTQEAIDRVHKIVGHFPREWGRYLDGVKATEVALLKAAGIKLKLISRRSSRVTLGLSQGVQDATEDHAHYDRIVRGLLATDIDSVVWLDIEQTPTLNDEYYVGWSSVFRSVPGVCPGVYIPSKANWPEQWDALDRAMQKGASCAGAWVAWYNQPSEGQAIYQPEIWDTKVDSPGSRVPVVAWQHTGNACQKRYDFNSYRTP